MKRSMLVVAIALPVLLSACSLMKVSSRVPGYLTTPGGELLLSQDGQCWRTAEWRPALAITQCDPEVVKAREAERLAEEEKQEEKAEEVAEEKGPRKGREHAGYIFVPEDEAAIAAGTAGAAIVAVGKEEAGRVEVTFAPLSLNSDTSFRFGDDRLTPDGRDAVIEMASLLKMRKVQDLKLTVIGHTDRVGDAKANMDLSRRRAATVKAAFVAEGIPAAAIETGGMGATMPVTNPEDCPNDLVKCELIDCLRPDRRVEIKARGKVESGSRSVPRGSSIELMPQKKALPRTAAQREEARAICTG